MINPNVNIAARCLTSVKVLDLTQFEAGTSCTQVLAWLGADVIKVENPVKGDPGRRMGDTTPHKDDPYFLMFNANKKSLTVNLKSSRGLEIIKDLVREADVFVENFAPGTIERLGLGYDVVSKLNPGIIYGQVKGFGEGSPYEKNLAFDMIAQATGGSMSVTGELGRPPSRPGASLGDTGAGMLMAISILGALYRRTETGEGVHLVGAMEDAVLHYISGALGVTLKTGKAAPRMGAKSIGGGNPPANIYACAPGGPNDYVYIYTSRANPTHWPKLLEVMGRKDLIGDKRYDTREARAKNELEVDAIISEWTRKHTKYEAMDLVGAAGIPAGAVRDTAELLGDPDFVARGIIQVVEHPSHGAVKLPTWPVNFDGRPPVTEPAPLLGQHTTEALSSWLGMKEEEIAVLRAQKVV